MTLTCLVKKQMAGSTLNKGVFGHFLFLVNYSGIQSLKNGLDVTFDFVLSLWRKKDES